MNTTFSKTNRATFTRLSRASKAQSLAEFAIALPLLFLLLSGLVEFGFALNYYLSLLDATRDAARYHSNLSPFDSNDDDDINFYESVAGMVIYNLDPSTDDSSYVGRKIPLNPATDEVIVTVYAKSSSGVVRYPTSGPFRAFSSTTESLFTSAEVEDLFVEDSPNAGVLIVEVHYSYNAVMNLPWIAPLFPMKLRAYTVMPLAAAEPP